MPMVIVNRRGKIMGKPGIVWARDDSGAYDCYIDGERTVDGRARHDMYAAEHVELSSEVAVTKNSDVPW